MSLFDDYARRLFSHGPTGEGVRAKVGRVGCHFWKGCISGAQELYLQIGSVRVCKDVVRFRSHGDSAALSFAELVAYDDDFVCVSFRLHVNAGGIADGRV